MDSKIAKLTDRRPLRVLDLFAGCGGLSLGFQRAGFEILGGIELDPKAASTYAANIHRATSKKRRELLGQGRDLRKLAPGEFLKDLEEDNPETAIDIIVGGPPCQAYARVGRAKLREVHCHPEAYQYDERGALFLQYLRYVRELKPLALLMENVPDILIYGGRNIACEIAESLRELGYRVNFGLLNAAAYGIPQLRRRLYLVAYAEILEKSPSFPLPTNYIHSLPSGYREFEALEMRLRNEDSPFCGPPVTERTARRHRPLPPAVTVHEAIGDLPLLTSHLDGTMKGGRRRFDETLPYSSAALSEFAWLMRHGWPGFAGEDGVCDHVTRLLPRDYKIFEKMKEDDDYPKAHRIACQVFEKELTHRRKKGESLSEDSESWRQLRKIFVPPYDPHKFPNKWRKMSAQAPARTLLAHLAHDGYTHIHYDSAQARTISVREAARLQSFPDGFQFYEAMNPAFKMIGNAVPPLLAYQLAQHLQAELQDAARSLTQMPLAC